MAGSRDTPGGWYPQAAPVDIPLANFTHGFKSRDAVVLHIIVGSQASARSKFQNAASRVSSHFSISKAGRVEQYVSVLDTAYGNGLSWNGQHWVDPEGYVLDGTTHPAPTWAGLRPPTNPNTQTISIEHEGQPADVPTLAMTRARTDLLRWLGQFFTSLARYIPHQSLIGHYEISPANRPNCPGPHVDYAAIALAGSLSTAAPYLVRGLPIYNDSQGHTPSGRYLLPGTKVTIDRVAAEQPDDYREDFAHVSDADGGGFIDLNGAVRV